MNLFLFNGRRGPWHIVNSESNFGCDEDGLLVGGARAKDPVIWINGEKRMPVQEERQLAPEGDRIEDVLEQGLLFK